MKKNNFLFVATGRRVSLIEEFNKYKKDSLFIGVDSSSFVPTKNLFDDFVIVPKWDFQEEFIQNIYEIVQRYSIKYIVSLMDTSTKILLNSPYFSEKLFIGSTKQLNKIASSKKRTYDFFRLNGISTPDALPRLKFYKKCIFRPILGGTGSRGIFIANDEIDFDYFVRKNKNILDKFLVTEFIDGNEYTIDCYSDIKGSIKSIVPRKRLEVRGGEVQKAILEKDKNLILETKKVLNLLPKFFGCICIQCIKTNNNEYLFTEINDRFGGGCPFSIKAGANFPKWILQEVSEETPSYEQWAPGIFMRADREFCYEDMR